MSKRSAEATTDGQPVLSKKSLAGKALAGLAKRVFVVSVLLFVPACSLRFWNAWVFLPVYYVPQLWIVFYLLERDPALLERRLKGGPPHEPRGRQKAAMWLVSLSMCALFVAAGFDHRFGWSRIHLYPVIAANIIIVAGLWTQFSAFRANSFASAIITTIPTQKVISTGPYAFVRHPMYLGGLLANFASAIALGSWWALPFAFAWLGAIVVRVLDEECLLRQNLPGYEAYSRKVRFRLIPCIW